MVDFVCKLAGVTIGVTALFPSTREYCAAYLVDGAPAVSVTVTETDVAAERAAMLRQQEIDGTDFPLSDAFLETLALYRKIADALIPYGVLLFHGSALSVDGKGYLFTARSGVGKSTHARLWREEFGDRVTMINDDKPFLRVSDSGVYVCGTPWCGVHRLGTNTEVPLDSIVLLSRAPENSIQPVSAPDAFQVLLTQTYLSSDPALTPLALASLDRVFASVRLFRLRCNMSPDAARIAYAGLVGKDH